MSGRSDNTAVIESAYAAFARGDAAAVLSLLQPDVEWVETVALGIPNGKIAGLRNYHDTALWFEAFGDRP